MKTVIIGFSKSRKKFAPLSQLICWIEGTEYSHVYAQFDNVNLENELFYQASGTAVNFMGSDLFHKNNEVVEEFKITLSDHDYYKLLDSAISRVGHPYSLSQLCGILVVRMFKIFGKDIQNPFGKKGYICTEIVAELLKEIYEFSDEFDINSIRFRDILKILNKHKLQNESN